MRDITGAAGVDVALANYYFGSKGGLLEAVFHRRSEVLNAERLQRLEAVLAARPTASQPSRTSSTLSRTRCSTAQSAAEPGWKSYFALVAEVNNSPEWGNVLMTRHFDPLVQKIHRRHPQGAAGLRGSRPVLGLSLPVGRAHADLRGDGAHRPPLERRVPLE